MNADPRPYDDEAARPSVRSTAAILQFDRTVGRRFRRVADQDAAIGEILLFTGVRYERQSVEDLHAEGSHAEDSHSKTSSREEGAMAARAGKPS